jgi:hypothetical protein
MSTTLKRRIAWTAILAIALQALLPGFIAQPASAAAFDPGTVICHSDAAGDANQSAPQPALADDCCAQCVLCNSLASTAPPIVAPNYVIWTVPGDILAVQSSSEPVATHHPTDNFARGPPLFA